MLSEARFTDGHSRGEAVRVEEDVRSDAALRERHALHRPLLTADALLSVPTRELVADDRVANNAKNDDHATKRAVTALVTKHLQHENT